MKVTMGITQALKLIRLGLGLGNVEAAIALLDDLIPQAEAWEKGEEETAKSLDEAGL